VPGAVRGEDMCACGDAVLAVFVWSWWWTCLSQKRNVVALVLVSLHVQVQVLPCEGRKCGSAENLQVRTRQRKKAEGVKRGKRR